MVDRTTVPRGLSTLQVLYHALDLRITGEWNTTSVPTQPGGPGASRSRNIGTQPNQWLRFHPVYTDIPWF